MPGEYLQCEGEFLVVADKPKSGWLGRSKEKQTPYLQIRFTVEEGTESGKEITWFGYLSDRAIERTIEALNKAFGFNGDLNALYSGQQSFEGMKARITVEAENYEGKQRFKAKWLNPAEYDGPPALPDAEARMLIAGLNKRTMAAAQQAAVDAPAKAPAAKAAAPVVTPQADDDAPF